MKNRKKETPIPLMNEGLGELKCRRHFLIIKTILHIPDTGYVSFIEIRIIWFLSR